MKSLKISFRVGAEAEAYQWIMNVLIKVNSRYSISVYRLFTSQVWQNKYCSTHSNRCYILQSL